MSGAEAIVAFGIAANVLQFVQFTAKLCSRIREYASGSSLPKKFAAQADRLSNLLNVLESVNKSSDQEALNGQILLRCQSQAQELSDFLDDLKSDGQRQSWAKNAKKAFRSLNRSDQIEELQGVLDSLVGMLSLQLQADTRSTASQVQTNTVSILQRQLEQTSLLSDLRHMAGLRDPASDNAGLSAKALWMVPIGRNPDFVGRTAVMSTLASRLTAKPDVVPTAVLCGLGGVGKSQIALEYAYRERALSTNISVLWVHAGNAARFFESYKRIASECQIPGRDDPNMDVLQLVRSWLEIKYECRWVMIVDNIDDRNMFFEAQTFSGKALREYIPQTPKGSILYTTRNRSIGMDLALDRAPITVPSMDVEEARILLGPKVRAESTESEQLELLSELVYLPLAISQAAAFMVKRHKNAVEYLKLYRGDDSTRIRLLGQRFNHHGREARPLESVVTTWWLSFTYIKQENPRAAVILAMMSFMDQQGIPFSLLVADGEDEFDFEEAMSLLEDFSLVTLDAQGCACNIHRLVKTAIQAWLSEYENKRETFAVQVLETLSNRFPDGSFENWPTCREYLSHAEEVLHSNVIINQASSLHAKASLLLNMSDFYRTQGRYEASELRAVESLNIFELLYGSEHPDTLSARHALARTLEKLGRYQDALLLQRQVFKSRELLLGMGHRATLESMDVLGSILQTLGQYKEAEEIHRRELTEKLKVLSEQPDDIVMQADVLIAKKNIARVLSHQRRFVEAEKLYQEALDRDEIVLGQLHPDVFITRGELAGTVRDQDRLDEAEQMYNALLKDRSKILGDRHPDTLITLKSLATVSARQGNPSKAECIYREALRIEQEIFSATHPAIINTMHNLACSAFDRKDYSQAGIEFKAVLELQRVALGPAHPFTIRTRHNLAIALRISGDLEQAIQLDNETLELCKSLDDNKVAEQIETLENLASSLKEQERYKDAESIRRQELELRKDSGEDEGRIQNTLVDLGFCLSKQGKYHEAEHIYKQMLLHATSRHGPEHKETLRVLWNLALTYREQNDYARSESAFSHLVDVHSQTLGSTHPSTLDSLTQHAWSLQQVSKYAQAEQRYRFLLETRGKGLGPEHWITLLFMSNLAATLKRQDGASDEATTLFGQVHEIQLRMLGPESEAAKRSAVVLAGHLRDCVRYDEADEVRHNTSRRRERDKMASESESLPETGKDLAPD